MKKTIVAAAVAAVVAAPAAFADVSISGAAQMEVLSGDGQAATGNGTDSAFDLNFKSSEDLGNGMKAFAEISLQSDFDNSSTVGRNNQLVGLSGDFGTLTTGKIETFTEGKVSAMASVDSSENLGIEPGVGSDRATKGMAIAYSSPSMNGLNFNVACVIDETRNSTALDGSDDCDVTDVMVQYSNAGLTVRYGNTDYGNATNNGAAGSATNLVNREVQALGAQYAMGDMTLIAVVQNTKRYNGTSEIDIDGHMVGAKYKMGNNTIGLGYMEQDVTTTTEEKQYIVDFNHALSKSTSVYLTHHKDNNPSGTADVSMTAVGLKHSF
jgi:predicted porin